MMIIKLKYLEVYIEVSFSVSAKCERTKFRSLLSHWDVFGVYICGKIPHWWTEEKKKNWNKTCITKRLQNIYLILLCELDDVWRMWLYNIVLIISKTITGILYANSLHVDLPD